MHTRHESRNRASHPAPAVWATRGPLPGGPRDHPAAYVIAWCARWERPGPRCTIRQSPRRRASAGWCFAAACGSRTVLGGRPGRKTRWGGALPAGRRVSHCRAAGGRCPRPPPCREPPVRDTCGSPTNCQRTSAGQRLIRDRARRHAPRTAPSGRWRPQGPATAGSKPSPQAVGGQSLPGRHGGPRGGKPAAVGINRGFLRLSRGPASVPRRRPPSCAAPPTCGGARSGGRPGGRAARGSRPPAFAVRLAPRVRHTPRTAPARRRPVGTPSPAAGRWSRPTVLPPRLVPASSRPQTPPAGPGAADAVPPATCASRVGRPAPPAKAAQAAGGRTARPPSP